MKDFYDVIIVGTGPGGMGTAFKVSENTNKSILMVDKNTYSSGGMLNDNKQCFRWPICYAKEYWSEEMATEYLKECEKYLKPKFLPQHDLTSYENKAREFDSELYVMKQSHIGTDKSKAYINNLMDQLRNNGVDIHLNKEVLDIRYDNKTILFKSGEVVKFGKLVLSVGRSGANWLQSMMDKLGVTYVDNIVDIGIRVETLLSNYEIVNKKLYYDPKYYLPGEVRTFCTNSGNCSVVKESYGGYFSCNGHALSDEKEPNGLVNFAMLKTVTLTDPLESGTRYAQVIGKTFMALTGGKPMMQRVGDLKLGKRSKRENCMDINKHGFLPTLRSSVCGDVTLAFPARIWKDLWNGLETLDGISPGILNDNTIIYAPEIKLYANKPVFMDEYFKVKEDIYMHSDGAGTSRGITGAFSSGLRCGNGIIQE